MSHVSWKHDELLFYTQKVNSFLLQNLKHYIEFRKHTLNNIDWGKDGCLEEIRNSLDGLLEERRRKVSDEIPPATFR
jgi:hypothetical protein